ncbi:hypothetical protein RJ641_006702, partial [Dillenia turbinata]
MSGNPYSNMVLVYGVGGAGNVWEVQNWLDYNEEKLGTEMGYWCRQTLSFRVTTSDGESLEFYEVAPYNWQFGQ